MAKERIVRATFSNAEVLERGSVSKVYTHAYQFSYRNKETGKVWTRSGFSTSGVQCERNLSSESAWQRNHPDMYEMLSAEVVAVVLIDKRGAP